MSELSELPGEEIRAQKGIKTTLDTLQGWWENMAVRGRMVRVKDDAVFISNKKKGGPIQVCSNRKVRWGPYSGTVQLNGREISWSPGNITWMYIGILPDVYDAETNQGRWRYDEFLGKGSSGCVFEVEDLACKVGPPRKLAVKVLRSFCGYTKKRNHEDVFKLHQEFQWSHLKLHNRSHEHYQSERARLIVEYLEDHTGFPEGETITMFAPGVAELLCDASNFVTRPYVVMELDGGTLLWDVLSNREQRRSREEKGKIIQQTAMALDYMGKFNLAHRDLRLHNVLVSGFGDDCRIKILDLGRVSDRTRPEVFSFSQRDEAHWSLRDWIPWEEWVLAGKPKGKTCAVASAFDVFSMGVILLYLCVGQTEARHIIDKCRKGKHHLTPEQSKNLVLDGDFVLRMLSKDPAERPVPVEVLNAFANKRRKLN